MLLPTCCIILSTQSTRSVVIGWIPTKTRKKTRTYKCERIEEIKNEEDKEEGRRRGREIKVEEVIKKLKKKTNGRRLQRKLLGWENKHRKEMKKCNEERREEHK